MEKAKKVFSQFYTEPVDIYRITKNSSYSSCAKTELVCSVLADIQPYGGGLNEEEFGFCVEKKFKMYCADYEAVSEGNYVEVGGEMYKIVSVKRWDIGIEALLENSGL